MLKFYHIYAYTYHNGVEINWRSDGDILTDKELAETVYHFTWENLSDLYSELGLGCSFNIWNMKKGRRVSFFHDKWFPSKDFQDIKEWTNEPLNIDVKYIASEFNPSITFVLNWHNSIKAAQYLKQIGFNYEKEYNSETKTS